MKKIISTLLAFALLSTCAMSAFAAPAPLLSPQADIAPQQCATEVSVDMSEAEIQEYAYMDIDVAVNELRAKVLSARNSYIWSKDWYDDSVPGGEPATWGVDGQEYVLPGFSTLFPSDWKNPSNAEWDTIASVDKSILPKTQADKEYYAYLDLDAETQVLKEKILAARSELIFRQDWAADGIIAYYVDPQTGKSEKLPQFSDLFPDWDLPISLDAPDGLSEASDPEIMPRDSVIWDYGQISIPRSDPDKPASLLGKELVLTRFRWIRMYANNYENTDTINMGFSYLNGTSIVHKRNVPSGGYLTLYASSCTRPSVYGRVSQYTGRLDVSAHVYIKGEPK